LLSDDPKLLQIAVQKSGVAPALDGLRWLFCPVEALPIQGVAVVHETCAAGKWTSEMLR